MLIIKTLLLPASATTASALKLFAGLGLLQHGLPQQLQ